MKKEIATGTHDFKEIIETNSLYIDKTLFIKELIDDTSKVVCFPRPRRFGKSLNMSMLDYYFNREYDDSEYLFKGLNINKEEDKYLMEMNKYPVISLSLKELKKDTYQEFIDKYKTLMANLYLKYKIVLENSNVDKDFYNRIIKKEEESELADSLSYLVNYLKK